MFITIITPFDEYRFHCDSVRTRQPADIREQKPFIMIEIYKGSQLIATQHVDKEPDNAVYFMNDQGQTVDSLSWHH